MFPLSVTTRPFTDIRVKREALQPQAEHEVVTAAEHEIVTKAEREFVTEAVHGIVTDAENDLGTKAEHETVTKAEHEIVIEPEQEIVIQAQQKIVVEVEPKVATKSQKCEDKKIDCWIISHFGFCDIKRLQTNCPKSCNICSGELSTK